VNEMPKSKNDIEQEKLDIDALAGDNANVNLVMGRVATLEEAFHALIGAYEVSVGQMGEGAYMPNSAVKCKQFAQLEIEKARAVL
jgi:hypothetical protein